jgi:hypothetical protein
MGELVDSFRKMGSAHSRYARAVKPGLFTTRSVSEGHARNPSLTLRVTKNAEIECIGT